MSNYNNVNRVLIGDGSNAGAITSLAGIQAGDLFLIDESNNIVATNAAAAALARFEKVTIAAGIGDGIAVLSSPIQGNTVSKYESTVYSAPSEQVVILGYNGVAATGIAITPGDEYRLRVAIQDSSRVNGQRPTLSDVNVQTGATSTAQSVAYECACLYGQTDYDHSYMQDKVSLERVSDGTFTALANDANVIQGSKTVTSTGHGLAVGDIVRIGGTGAGVAVYVVEAVPSANEFTLDLPYVGATATILAANVGSLAGVTEWGFKLSALPQEGLPGVDEYEWIKFDAVFSNADDLSANQVAATFTQVTAANPGQGYWKQVRDREEAAKGYLGDTSKRRFHDTRIASNVVANQTYSSIVITHADVHRGDFQDNYNAPLKTEIYIPSGSSQGSNAGNDFIHILNGFFSGVLGFTASPAL